MGGRITLIYHITNYHNPRYRPRSHRMRCSVRRTHLLSFLQHRRPPQLHHTLDTNYAHTLHNRDMRKILIGHHPYRLLLRQQHTICSRLLPTTPNSTNTIQHRPIMRLISHRQTRTQTYQMQRYDHWPPDEDKSIFTSTAWSYDHNVPYTCSIHT